MLQVPEDQTHVQPSSYEPEKRPDEGVIWDFAFNQWGDLDPKTIEPRRWIYGQHYLEGALSATIADGAVGKSILSLTEAIAIVTGKPLLGVTPSPPLVWEGNVEPRQVLYFNAEESLAELQRRVCAICQHFNIDPRTLTGHYQDDTGKWIKTGRLDVVSGHDFPMVIGKARNGNIEFNELNLECLENADGVVILDPFVSIHQVPENDNSMVDAIVKRLGRVAAKHQSVELVHHSRKASGEIDGTDARGASAIFDGVRALRVLNRMTDAEAQRAKIEDPRCYFRVTAAKANYSALSPMPMWLQHRSVILPNGDVVGVVVPWRMPGMFDSITPEHTKQVHELAKDGEYRVDSQSKEWIGKAVAEVLGYDVENETERDVIKAILKKWFADGVLKKVARRSKDRHLTMVVEAGKLAR